MGIWSEDSSSAEPLCHTEAHSCRVRVSGPEQRCSVRRGTRPEDTPQDLDQPRAQQRQAGHGAGPRPPPRPASLPPPGAEAWSLPAGCSAAGPQQVVVPARLSLQRLLRGCCQGRLGAGVLKTRRTLGCGAWSRPPCLGRGRWQPGYSSAPPAAPQWCSMSACGTSVPLEKLGQPPQKVSLGEILKGLGIKNIW